MIDEASDRQFCVLRAQLAAGEPVRRKLPQEGQLYLDRLLPFLCVHRRAPSARDSFVAHLPTSQAAYLVASGAASYRAELSALIETIVAEQAEAFGSCLVVELWSGPARRNDAADLLEPYFRIVAPEEERLADTVDAMAKALKEVTLHELPASITFTCSPEPVPPELPFLLPAAVPDSAAVIGLEVAPVYWNANADQFFPFLFEQLRRQLAEALKKTFFHFAHARTSFHPAHFLALGNRTLEEVALTVDHRLGEIDESFDFLLQTTPVNAQEEWERFEQNHFEEPPAFRYRPLPVDPELLKRDLFDLPIEKVEDPALAELFREKQEELDRKITMLRDRGTRAFFFESLQLFGEVRPALLALAEEVLDELPVHDYDFQAREHLDADDFAQLAGQELAFYRRDCPDFPTSVQVRRDIPAGLMVSQGKLLMGQATKVPSPRVDALLQHEVGTHMLTYFNGRTQPLRLLCTGLAGYEALQEGLAVLAEYLVGGLNVPRLRVLAARVVAAHCLIEGASFIEVFRLLTRTHDFKPDVAFTIAMRTFRGGGMIKDVIYLRGLHELMEHLRGGGALESLFVGKIALRHVPLLEELEQRGVLRPVPLRPRYLERAQTPGRLQRIESGLTFIDLVEKKMS